MAFYNLKSEAGGYRISKVDADLNVESSYIVDATGCECPQWQGRQRQCRHMKMIPLMEDRANTGWFFNFEDGTWHDLLGYYADHDLPEADEPTEEELAQAERPEVEITPSLLTECRACKNISYEADGGCRICGLDRDAGEGPGPSTLAAEIKASPSQDVQPYPSDPGRRGEPATIKRRF